VLIGIYEKLVVLQRHVPHESGTRIIGNSKAHVWGFIGVFERNLRAVGDSFVHLVEFAQRHVRVEMWYNT